MPKAKTDFRDEAVAASLAMIQPDEAEDLLPLGLSLCVPRGDARSWEGAGKGQLVVLIVSVVGIVLGGILAVASESPAVVDRGLENVVLGFGFTMSVGSISTLFLSIFARRRMVKKRVAEYVPAELAPGDIQRGPISVENAATYAKLKLNPEDEGMLVLSPSRRALLIEGIRYRYCVFGDDLESMEVIQGGNSRGTAVGYRIGDVVLRICIAQDDNLGQELRRQLGMPKRVPKLTQEIAETLSRNESDEDEIVVLD